MLAAGQEEFVAIAGLKEAKRDSYGGVDDGKIHHTRELLSALNSSSEIKSKGKVTYSDASGKKYRTNFTIDHRCENPETFVIFDGVEPA